MEAPLKWDDVAYKLYRRCHPRR